MPTTDTELILGKIGDIKEELSNAMKNTSAEGDKLTKEIGSIFNKNTGSITSFMKAVVGNTVELQNNFEILEDRLKKTNKSLENGNSAFSNYLTELSNLARSQSKTDPLKNSDVFKSNAKNMELVQKAMLQKMSEQYGVDLKTKEKLEEYLENSKNKNSEQYKVLSQLNRSINEITKINKKTGFSGRTSGVAVGAGKLIRGVGRGAGKVAAATGFGAGFASGSPILAALGGITGSLASKGVKSAINFGTKRDKSRLNTIQLLRRLDTKKDGASKTNKGKGGSANSQSSIFSGVFGNNDKMINVLKRLVDIGNSIKGTQEKILKVLNDVSKAKGSGSNSGGFGNNEKMINVLKRLKVDIGNLIKGSQEKVLNVLKKDNIKRLTDIGNLIKGFQEKFLNVLKKDNIKRTKEEKKGGVSKLNKGEVDNNKKMINLLERLVDIGNSIKGTQEKVLKVLEKDDIKRTKEDGKRPKKDKNNKNNTNNRSNVSGGGLSSFLSALTPFLKFSGILTKMLIPLTFLSTQFSNLKESLSGLSDKFRNLSERLKNFWSRNTSNLTERLKNFWSESKTDMKKKASDNFKRVVDRSRDIASRAKDTLKGLKSRFFSPETPTTVKGGAQNLKTGAKVVSGATIVYEAKRIADDIGSRDSNTVIRRKMDSGQNIEAGNELIRSFVKIIPFFGEEIADHLRDSGVSTSLSKMIFGKNEVYKDLFLPDNFRDNLISEPNENVRKSKIEDYEWKLRQKFLKGNLNTWLADENFKKWALNYRGEGSLTYEEFLTMSRNTEQTRREYETYLQELRSSPYGGVINSGNVTNNITQVKSQRGGTPLGAISPGIQYYFDKFFQY